MIYPTKVVGITSS